MKEKALAKAIAITGERATYWCLALAILGLFISYSIMVNATIHNVVARQRLESEMSVLTTKISELEFQYITMQNEITIDKAYAMGFKDAAAPKYVSRRALSQVALREQM